MDPHKLNKTRLREPYIIPILEDVLHDKKDARIFTKVD